MTWIVGVAGAGSFRLAQMSVVAATNVLGRLGPMSVLFAAVGCASVGPVMVPRDRVDYITAVAESWKEQTLLNVVRMRYGDAPTFVDVSSVVSAYAFQGQLSAGAAISSDLTNAIPRNLVTLGGNATFVDRPTITYTPLGGDKFAKSLLRPIPPSAIFELIQAGYPSDYILQMTARAVNGVYNRASAADRCATQIPSSIRSWMRCDVCSSPGRSVCGLKSAALRRSAF